MFIPQTKKNIDFSTKTTLSLLSKFSARDSKVVLIVTLTLSLVIGSSFSTVVPVYSSSSPTPECTLSILNGSVEVQEPGSGNWEQAVNGMSLITGNISNLNIHRRFHKDSCSGYMNSARTFVRIICEDSD